MNRGPLAEIDLTALQHNLAVLRNKTGKRPVIGVVKADAYGHGAIAIAGRLVAEGVSHLAVAFISEARLLREAGIAAPILVLFDHTEQASYFDLNLIPVVSDSGTADLFSREAERRRTVIGIHLKIDTGMGRLGIVAGDAVAHAAAIAALPGVELQGLMSHFSEADLADRTYALEQMQRFRDIASAVAVRVGRTLLCHMANSAAALALGDALFDAVRPGILLYGCSPTDVDHGLKPLMKVSVPVLTVRRLPAGHPVSYGRTFVTKRDSTIAVLPVGYADGFNRRFSNNADVLINGRRVPVIGRVCMDLTMVDVTAAGPVSEGAEAVILGSQGSDTITAAELAGRIGTIPYEILLALGSRARRSYRR